MAYTGIASTVISGTSISTVTFSSIPQTYKDLILRISCNTTGGSAVLMTYNGLTSGYNYISFFNNTATNNSSLTSINIVGTSGNSHTNRFSVGETIFYNYTNTTYPKHISATHSYYWPGSSLYTLQSLEAGNSTPTAAITSITLTSSNFADGSRFDLYGVS